MKTTEMEIEDNLRDSNDVVAVKYEITSYGADLLVDGIVKRLGEESIFIPPFQRNFVWTLKQSSRFIESLLLGLPVPGIFLSREYRTQKMLVIDGQQRLKTLQFFYQGVFSDTGKEFCLKGVQNPFEGVTYRALSDEDRRRLDNSIIHATIVQQDRPADDDSSIYYLFERLNAYGTPLQPQEIRSSVFHGPLEQLIRRLNDNSSWRRAIGPKNKRMKDQELILRFFALYFDAPTYTKPMREFLNSFMRKNRFLQVHDESSLFQVFNSTIDILFDSIGEVLFKPARAINAAVVDSVMIGIARRLEKGLILDRKKLVEAYTQLITDDQFKDLVSTSTADELNVKQRLLIATNAFKNLQ